MFQIFATRCLACSEFLTADEAGNEGCPHCESPFTAENYEDLEDYRSRQDLERRKKEKNSHYTVHTGTPDSGQLDPVELWALGVGR